VNTGGALITLQVSRTQFAVHLLELDVLDFMYGLD